MKVDRKGWGQCDRVALQQEIVSGEDSQVDKQPSNIKCEADAEKKRNKTKSVSKSRKKLLHGKVKFMPHFLYYEFVRFKQVETEN